MSVDGLIPLLAQGPFVFFAITIGLVVSMDVAVVELTRIYKKEDRNGKPFPWWTSGMQSMTFLHAFFHSLSFWLYMMTIYLMQSLFFWPIDVFDLPEDIGIGLLTLINFIIVAFIWWTYKSKVKEDHSNKSAGTEPVDRKDMKILVDLVRVAARSFDIHDWVVGAAVAGSVAVDMLAVSALLKGILLPNGGEAPIASWTGNLLVDITVFAGIIFVVVAIVVFIAQAVRATAGDCPLVVVFFRVLEPIAVFFILAGVARLVAGQISEILPNVYIIYGDWIDLVFAVVVTFSLFWSNGIGPQRLMKLYGKHSVHENSLNPRIRPKQLWNDLKGFVPAGGIVLIVFAIVFLCMWYAYSTDPGRETHNHLVEATGYIAGLMVLLTIVFLYAPSKRLDNWERSETENLHKIFPATPKESFNRLCAVFLALLALNIHTFLVLGRTIESESIVLWSGYVMFGWALVEFRRWRFSKSHVSRTNNADYAELVTAFGLGASAVVALVASNWVQQLIG